MYVLSRPPVHCLNCNVLLAFGERMNFWLTHVKTVEKVVIELKQTSPETILFFLL